MDKPIDGDKYVRTLSHYLRSNQRRLLPASTVTQTSTSSSSGAARSFVTPADPMAAAYSGMVNSLWNVGTAVVNSITPTSDQPPPSLARDRDSYNGSWDGTGSIPSDANPREQQLYLQAQLRAPIFPLDLYYLLYLLDRFEQVGIELEGWDGATPRTVGTSTPRVLNSGPSNNGRLPNSSTYSSFPPPAAASSRPQSIRSFQSTALSTLTLITGWKQWSTAASSGPNNLTITDDVHFIHKFLQKIPSLRLVAKIPPGLHIQGKGRIEGYSGDAILSLFNNGESHQLTGSTSTSSAPLLLPLATTFSSLTHLELHKIPPRAVEGWETLMVQLKSLVVIQAGIEDVYDVVVTAVVDSERRRRQRVSKERTRQGLIKQEQKEALKDAATAMMQGQAHDDGVASSSSSTAGTLDGTTTTATADAATGNMSSEDEEKLILGTLKMWPALRHLSVSDNSFPSLTHSDTFTHTQAIISLDLSHNLLLSPPPALIHLHNLHELNLSYNMITSVQAIYQILGNIAVLDLRGNRLDSLCGLERLWNLEKIDVRENHLDEAAEVGRLAALPQIREVWSDRNPFCTIQPRHRLEILAVFKANGHDLLLDGTFASFNEKRMLANLSPSSFSTTISSINNVANIPPASAPVATWAKDLSPRGHTFEHGSNISNVNKGLNGQDGERPTSAFGFSLGSSSAAAKDQGLNATSPPGSNSQPPVSKLVKKKLVKSSKRVKRVVNLDSDHEDEEHQHHQDRKGGAESDGDENGEAGVLGSPAAIGTKKKTKKDGGGKEKTKKKSTKKKASAPAGVSFAGDEDGMATGRVDQDGVDHSLCRENHHVHRLAHLEKSMAAMQVGSNNSDNHHNGNGHGTASTAAAGTAGRPFSPTPSGSHSRQPSRSILKKPSGHFGASSPPKSLDGSLCSSSDEEGNEQGHVHPHGHHVHGRREGADAYRRRIEAMRSEAGPNWLKVLAEMDGEAAAAAAAAALTKSPTSGGAYSPRHS